MIRVAVVDDSAEMRVALRLLLRLFPNVELVAEGGNGKEALDCVRAFHPDILIMDVQMPVLNGLEATRQIVDLAIPTRVILISFYLDSFIRERAAVVGAWGLLRKEDVATLLLPAMEAVQNGETFFRG